jgi:ribosomal protein S18 acetylase RimI-like enzyme
MNYTVENYNDIIEIPYDVDAFLNEEPAINFEAIEILEKLRDDPNSYEGVLECVVVSNQESILTVTCRMQPYNMLISHTRDLNSISTIVELCLKLKIEIPGIYGPLEEIRFFTKKWQDARKESFQTEDEFIQYSLKSLKLIQENIGDISIATEENKDLLSEWVISSIREILPNATKTFEESCVKSFLELLEKRRVFVLDVDGDIVSMAAISGRTKNMQAINDVYTPPKYRGTGHATELCTFLSDYIINDCKNLPVLWVKAKNKAAIHIYEKIGFEQVAKMALYLK